MSSLPGQSNSVVNLLPLLLLKPCSFTVQGWPTAPGHVTTPAPHKCWVQEHPSAVKSRARTPSNSQSTPSSVTQTDCLQEAAPSLGSHSYAISACTSTPLHGQNWLGSPWRPLAPQAAAAGRAASEAGHCSTQSARTWWEQPLEDAQTV